MRAVAFWVLSVAMSVTVAVRPALAHSDDPSFEGCHSAELNGPQHCHRAEDDNVSTLAWVIVGVFVVAWAIGEIAGESAWKEPPKDSRPPVALTKVGSTYGLTWTTEF